MGPGGRRQAHTRLNDVGHQQVAIVRRPFEQDPQRLGEGCVVAPGAQEHSDRAQAQEAECVEYLRSLLTGAETGQDFETAQRTEQFGLRPVVRVRPVFRTDPLCGESRPGLFPVGVDLDGQRLLGGEDFQQEGQLTAEPDGARRSELPFRVLGHHRLQGRRPSAARDAAWARRGGRPSTVPPRARPWGRRAPATGPVPHGSPRRRA